MKFHPTGLLGAFVVEVEYRRDDRGFFARTFCAEEFAAHGIELPVAQCNVSFNALQGTLRGLHYQLAPKAETKLVRCTRGAIYDVIVDLRPESKSYRQWFGAELASTNHRALFVPEGFAHGFQTLEDDAEVFYQMSEFYSPEHARGARWNDPALAIRWPLPVQSISDRDASYADLD
jgi:dTDP-4-dehydrorhamnose 3,5-epimerase